MTWTFLSHAEYLVLAVRDSISPAREESLSLDPWMTPPRPDEPLFGHFTEVCQASSPDVSSTKTDGTEPSFRFIDGLRINPNSRFRSNQLELCLVCYGLCECIHILTPSLSMGLFD
jgi:hypothetical protein